MTAAAQSAASAPRRLPLVIYVLTVGTFLMGTSEFLVAGLLPDIARSFSVSVAQAGFSITAFAVGMVVGTPAMVLLTLRVSRRTTLTAALLLFALGHVLAALSTGFPMLLVARFLTAVATGAFWAVASLVASDTAGPGGSFRAIALVGSGGMLANVLGVPLGSFLGHVVGWRGPFWMLAGAAAFVAIGVARLVPRETGSRNAPSVRGELAALRSVSLWTVLLTCALVCGGVFSVFSFISPLLTERTGLPVRVVPIVLLLFGVAAFVGILLGGRFGDRRPATTVLVCAAVTLLTLGALGVVSTDPVPTIALFTLLGLTGQSANPILFGFAIRYGRAAPTLASALVPSAFNLGTAVATGITAGLIGTRLAESAPTMVGTVSAALALVTFGGLTIAQRRGRSVTV